MTSLRMPGRCPEGAAVERLLRLREQDRLPSGGGRELATHLAACAACRTVALHRDSTLLFAPLALEQVADAEARALTADVVAALTVARSRRRLVFSRRVVTGLRLAAAAGFLAVLGGTWASWHGRLDSRTTASLTPHAPISRASVLVQPARLGSPPLLEEISAPRAKVYQFASSTQGEPTVVFVVDRDADI